MFGRPLARLTAMMSSRLQPRQLTSHVIRRTVVTTSNAPTRVPPPQYDNTVIKRRAFKGKTLHLTSLTPQHAPNLWTASGKGNQEMGEFLSGNFPATPLQFNYYVRDLVTINDDPFSRGVVFCIENMLERDMSIGIVSLRNISSANKTLDVGFIWVDKEFWGTHVNLETHYILMEEIFEFLKFNRVGFTVDVSDQRYQQFLEGIGAQREGTLRNYQINQESKTKDAYVYSIIEPEWPSVKAKMRAKIVQKLREQTEKAKEKLEKEGLLEAYNQAKELQPKKVVRMKREVHEQLEDDPEEKKLFEGEEEVNEQVEKMMKNQDKKQKKRPGLPKPK